jgi:hypothetical protein
MTLVCDKGDQVAEVTRAIAELANKIAADYLQAGTSCALAWCLFSFF